MQRSIDRQRNDCLLWRVLYSTVCKSCAPQSPPQTALGLTSLLETGTEIIVTEQKGVTRLTERKRSTLSILAFSIQPAQHATVGHTTSWVCLI